MFAVIGIVVVIAAIVGGYLMEHGELMVLLQPAELVIIGGAALGTVLIANPPPVLKQMAAGLIGILKPSRYNRKFYLETLHMLNQIFTYARKMGMGAIEADSDDPANSQLFQKFPNLLKDHHALHFVCDSLRILAAGSVEAFDLDQLLDLELETHHRERRKPVTALSNVADSLPGLGIVAAVLGVVITMGAIGGPPEQIGQKVAAALVGTFLGILLCYGFLGPLAANMGHANEAEAEYLYVLRVAIIAFAKGQPPLIAVEFGRRAVPAAIRPAFKEMEQLCRGGGAAAATPAAA